MGSDEHTAKIMIVDDEIIICADLESRIKAMGYEGLWFGYFSPPGPGNGGPKTNPI